MEDIFLVFAVQRKHFLQQINLTQFLVSLILCSLVYWSLIKLKGWFRVYQLASTMPGPKAYPIVGNLFNVYESKSVGAYKSKTCQLIKNSINKDDIVRFWVFHKLFVLIKDPVNAQEILKNINIKKASYYKTIFGGTALGQGILTQVDSEVWKRQRKILTPTFHFKILHSYIQYFYEEAVFLCNIIDKECATKSEIELDRKMKLAGFDMIVRNVLGIHINAQENPQHPFLLNIMKTMQLTQRRIYQPWLLNDTLFQLLGFHKEQEKTKREINTFMQKVIQMKRKEVEDQLRKDIFRNSEVKVPENRSEEMCKTSTESNSKQNVFHLTKSPELNNVEYEFTKHKSFLELLLEIGHASDDKMTDAEILPELTTIFFAAQDTTATTNATTLLLLAMHPEILNKVIEEIDLIFGGPANDDGRKPSPADLSEMVYLECIIKECTRLYPAAPLVARQIDEEIPLGKHVLPKGCSVMILIAAIHRHLNYYENPRSFIPDRFHPDESVSSPHWRKKHPYAFIPFSAGPRNCLGQKYAMLQMKTVISTILRRFTVVPSAKFQSISDIDRNMHMDITFRIENAVVGFKKRM